MKQQKTCMVVDDDEIDRLTVLSFVEEYAFLKITGSFHSPIKALDAIQKSPPDVLFLDVDMPEMTGLQLREKLLHIPVCIFITSYPDYALEGFELHALDFLVKPVTHQRFAVMIERVRDYLLLREKAQLLEHTIGGDTVFIKDGHTAIKLQLHDILYLEAMKDYTRVITAGQKHIISAPMGTVLQEKAFSRFIRIHRSYAVQKNFIQQVTARDVQVNNISLPIGRSYKAALLSLKGDA